MTKQEALEIITRKKQEQVAAVAAVEAADLALKQSRQYPSGLLAALGLKPRQVWSKRDIRAANDRVLAVVTAVNDLRAEAFMTRLTTRGKLFKGFGTSQYLTLENIDKWTYEGEYDFVQKKFVPKP